VGAAFIRCLERELHAVDKSYMQHVLTVTIPVSVDHALDCSIETWRSQDAKRAQVP
jgi:hypothetical protein